MLVTSGDINCAVKDITCGPVINKILSEIVAVITRKIEKCKLNGNTF